MGSRTSARHDATELKASGTVVGGNIPGLVGLLDAPEVFNSGKPAGTAAPRGPDGFVFVR